MGMRRYSLRFTCGAQMSRKTLQWKSRGQSNTILTQFCFVCLFAFVFSGKTVLKLLCT